MPALCSHDQGLTPDTSARDVARRMGPERNVLHVRIFSVPSGHGRGLSPDTSAEAV